MKDINDTMGIITSAITIIGVLISGFTILVSMEHTKLSYALLTHEERKKQKAREMIFLFFVWFILFSCIGYCISFFSVKIEDVQISQEESIDKEGINQNEDISTEEYVSEEHSVAKENEESIEDESTVGTYILIFGFFVIPGIVGIILAIIWYCKEKRDLVTRKKCCFSRYLTISSLIFLTIFFGEIICLMSYKQPFDKCWIHIFLLSGMCALCFDIFLCLLIPRFEAEISNIRIYYNNRYLYVFSMKEGYLVVGDNLYEKECVEYYLIDPNAINGSYQDAKNEHDVCIARDKIEIIYYGVEEVSEKIYDILRAVAYDCEVKGYSIGENYLSINVYCEKNTDKKVPFEIKVIKYAIGEKSEVDCPFDVNKLSHWQGNVLLIKSKDKKDIVIKKGEVNK